MLTSPLAGQNLLDQLMLLVAIDLKKRAENQSQYNQSQQSDAQQMNSVCAVVVREM